MSYPNNDAPSCQMDHFEYIKRCTKCYKIPLIKLISRDNKYYINYNCENGHKE
jgi:lysyl-tRNA synthetase class I